MNHSFQTLGLSPDISGRGGVFANRPSAKRQGAEQLAKCILAFRKEATSRERQTNLSAGAYTDLLHGADSKGIYRLEVELSP